jgi:prepilin-type processing-associated H-X9-DG protein
VGSYGINGWIIHPHPSMPPNAAVWGRPPASDHWGSPVHAAASQVPVFSDMWGTDAWPRENDQPPAMNGAIDGWPNRNEMERVCIARHDGAVNLLFMDWSARKVGLKGLWTLKWHRSFNTAGPWTTGGGVLPSDWPQWMREFREY